MLQYFESLTVMIRKQIMLEFQKFEKTDDHSNCTIL